MNYQIYKLDSAGGEIYITSHRAKKMTQHQVELVVNKIMCESAISESGYTVYLSESENSFLVLPNVKAYGVKKFYYSQI